MNEEKLLELFSELVSAQEWEEICAETDEAKKRTANQIYTLPVVIWLMVYQRLHPHGTQQEAVRELQKGGASAVLGDCKRIREGRVSGATGGYAQACGRLPRAAMETATDAVLTSFMEHGKEPDAPEARVWILDGTAMTVEHEADLLHWFPGAQNQHGISHWGVVRIVMAHNLSTGTPLRPAWGAMYGDNATSEQKLAESVMDRLPLASVIMGDANFGVFSIARGAQQRGLGTVLRLTLSRAKALMGSKKLPDGEQNIEWRPSAWDRRHHPEIGESDRVSGRCIVRHLAGFRQPLCLFTTLEGPAEEIVKLYLRRWNMETDLRSLKTTLRLQHLRAKTTAGVEKEFLAAVIAYGLVRAFITVAAQRRGLAPRQISFTGAWVVLNSDLSDLCVGAYERRYAALQVLLRDIAEKKLPVRRKPRSFERKIWGHRDNFPRRKPHEV